MKTLKSKTAAYLAAGVLMTMVAVHADDAGSILVSAEKVCPIKIGSQLPKIALTTTGNKPFDLNAAVTKKPTVLVFYRGGWCPYCNTQLSQLQKVEPELLKLGYQLLAVSPDAPAELPKSVDKNKVNYTLLSDNTMAAARALGIAFRVDDGTVEKYKGYGIDLEKSSGQTHHQLPVPAAFILDTKGVIQFAYVNPNYKVRLSSGESLAAAKAALEEKIGQ